MKEVSSRFATVHSLLSRPPREKLCVVQGEVSLTYGEVDEQSDLFAGIVKSHGAGEKDRVLIFLPNCWQFVVAMYAVLKSGAICVPMDYRSSQREVEFFMDNSRASLLITNQSKSEFIPAEVNQITIDTESTTLRMHAEANNTAPNEYGSAEDAAVILYTGGSTGLPKGVMLSHKNILSVLSGLSAAWGMRKEEEIFAQFLPMTHSGGLNCGLNSAIFNSGTTVIMRKFEPTVLLELVEKHGITAFAGVPTIFNALLRTEGLGRRNLSSLRICFSAGATLSPETAKSFKEKTGITINVGWGLTEASPQLTVAPLGVFKPDYVGLPLPDTRITALDEAQKVMPAGSVGELAAKGPQVMIGYWENEIETRNTITSEGWLLTGDFGYVVDDGVYIVGRKKDVINSGGYKIWPSEIESVLLENDKVLEVAVIGTRDELFGEALKAFVVPRSPMSKEELESFCRERLPGYKVPKRFEFRESLPKSSLGKILHRRLEEESG